jgi:hypothetical protein
VGRHSIPEPGESGDEPVDDRSNVDSGEHHVDVGDSGRSGAGSPPRPGNTPYPRYVAHPSDDPDEFPTIRGYADDDDSSYPDEGPDPDEDDSPDDDPGIARGPMRPPFALSRGGRSGVGGQWRGGHRNDGGHRGVSIGVIAALVTVVVVVGAVIAWRFFGDALSHRSRAAAARCLDGNETVAVIADPSIAEPVQRFADQYNRSATPVGDHCVGVSVKSADSDAVVNGFAANWPRDLGARPALWIPGSSVSAARLRATAGPQAISDSRSLATSPVLLAVRPELQRVLGGQSWATLPGLQSKPDGLTGVKLAAWGSMRLALPLSGNGDAAFLAAEAVAAASAPPGAPPTAGRAAVRTLIDAQPKLADNSLTEAMNVLLRPGDPAIAPVHAVVTTEQQLFQRGESLSDANSALASWLPPGPAAVADYPMVLLSGSWLSQEQVTAASAFARFMHKPDQLAELAKAGFRAAGTSLPSSDVTSFAALPPALSVGDDATRASLAKTLAAPATGLAATIMLDQSMTPDEGGKARLANVVAALDNRIRALPPNSVVALWTFDGTEGRPEVPSGPLADPVDGQPRSAALTAALNNQYPSASGAVSFTTLRLVYQEAQANFRAGRANSVLVITAGAHTDQSLDGSGLQDFLRRSVDPARPVMINVIDFGADPDRATWEAVAQISGGSYQNLATSASPELATAVDTVLS